MLVVVVQIETGEVKTRLPAQRQNGHTSVVAGAAAGKASHAQCSPLIVTACFGAADIANLRSQCQNCAELTRKLEVRLELFRITHCLHPLLLQTETTAARAKTASLKQQIKAKQLSLMSLER
jgi:hypothetical protein